MSSGSRERRRKGPDPCQRDHPFATDFGDHFATSERALRHAVPALKWLRQKKKGGGAGKGPFTLYDPFFCDGSIKKRLTALGFPGVQHENRDFWRDVKRGEVPKHDVLVTNPPYSGDHKKRTLDFVLSGNHRRPL